MDYNILKIVIDRAGRVIDTQNLSVNQCSTNNRIKVYYEGEYDYIEMAFRKPDGWLSDKVTLTFDVDEENYKYAYYDIDGDFTSFIMGGKHAILIGNIYLHYKLNGVAKIAALGNIRINVNYVDDALVHTNYSPTYMQNINSQIGALQNDLNRFKTGDVLVGKAISDQKGNTIDIYYETKADALDKYDDLNQKKLDKSEVQDQTGRIEILETSNVTSNNRISAIESDLDLKENQIDTNTSNIELLNNIKVSNDEFIDRLNERITAESKLQKQIDDLATSQNVKDIVGTRADLFAYNTSELSDGDRLQVLSDAAYDNLSTIYRWDATNKAWVYVGKYSSTAYSKTETDNLINSVKNTVPNKILSNNNKLYLYKDNIQIANQTTPVEFKTINGKSVIGTGNISTDNTDASFSSTSTNPVQNKLITAALNNKANQADLSTLSNIVSEKANISDLASKQDKLIAGANVTISENGIISVSSAIKFSKVEQLPTSGETNVIYLLRTTERDYTEYIWIDGKWEALGDARLSLENYYTAAEINGMIAERAYQTDLEALSNRVSSNTVSLASKADANTTSTSINLLNSSVTSIMTNLDNKINKEELSKYATKEEIPDVSSKQDKLVSGQNIKTINGVSVLGNGDLLVADAEIVDLGKYVLRTENEEALALKADKTELFNRDYNSLKNLPDLDVYATDDDITSVRKYVDDSIAEIPPTDLSNYYTKEEVDTAIENVDVSEELSNYYTKTEVDAAISTHNPDLTGYATETWVTGQGYMKTVDASTLFAVKSDIPTIPGNVSAFNNDAGYATVTYVDKEISDLIGTAPETFDTLKEIADYIEGDKTNAASMIASINTNTSSITKVKQDLATEASNRATAVSTVQSNLTSYSNTTNARLSNIEGQLGNKILFKNWTV